MKYRHIGNTSIKVSEIGLGGNTFGPPRLDKEQTGAAITTERDGFRGTYWTEGGSALLLGVSFKFSAQIF